MTTSRNILALDVATKLGWCVGRPGGTPLLGSVRLMGNGAEDGAIGCALIDWLADWITIHDPSLVAFEAPLQRGDHKGQAAGLITIGLVMAVKIVCWRREVRCEPFHVATVRAQTVGHGHAKKPEVAAWCASMGWKVPEVGGETDFDATDAAALWGYCAGVRAVRAARVRRAA